MSDRKKSTSDARPRAKKPAAATAVPVEAAPLAVATGVGAEKPHALTAAAEPTARSTRSGGARATRAPAAAVEPVVEPVRAAPKRAAGKAPTMTASEAAPKEPARRAPTHAEIAMRAHEIHRQRGGTAFDNWLQAERELRG